MDVYLCDNSIEGIFSAIYKAWEAGTSHTDVRCADVVSNYSLFENYINIRTDQIAFCSGQERFWGEPMNICAVCLQRSCLEKYSGTTAECRLILEAA